jgi:hypothetical protein
MAPTIMDTSVRTAEKYYDNSLLMLFSKERDRIVPKSLFGH